MSGTSELKIYNSLTSRKELFKPLQKNNVGIYVCGPTVYNKVHLGNCRTFISFDLIVRYLRHLGYNVRYVRNITDVGHLEDDSDDGEDRIAKKARLENIEPMEVVKKYSEDFHKTLREFKVLPPNIEPTATGHIIEQIDLIKKLIDSGFAYEVNGSVYFDIKKYCESYEYGILSNRKLEELIKNTRDLSGQSEKKEPFDFALWKKASKNHIMKWNSPWGQGFPGWHIECTAMSLKYLGNQIDIHGGGIDLKFPHHECEIAQGTALNSVPPVKTWMHTNMLTLNGKKMAKSTGNNILPEELFSGTNKNISEAFSPVVTRFFMMQAHYRNQLDISQDALNASKKGYQRLIKGYKFIDNLSSDYIGKSIFDVNEVISKFYYAMNDDFNTPVLIKELFEALKRIKGLSINKDFINKDDLKKLQNTFRVFLFDILGFEVVEDKNDSDEYLNKTVSLLIELRENARKNNDFKKADEIRENLLSIGIILKDNKNGTRFELK